MFCLSWPPFSLTSFSRTVRHAFAAVNPNGCQRRDRSGRWLLRQSPTQREPRDYVRSRTIRKTLVCQPLLFVVP
jgi:hypothetical protein